MNCPRVQYTQNTYYYIKMKDIKKNVRLNRKY